MRLALEANHLLPGDPNRVFNSFFAKESETGAATRNPSAEHEAPPPRDPTTIKPQESNPFAGT